MRVIRRTIRCLLHSCRLLGVLLLAGVLFLPAGHAQTIQIEKAHLVASEEGYHLSSSYVLEPGPDLLDVLHRGVALYLTTELEITRPRWYWFDAKVIENSRTLRLSYNLLTRQYHVSATGQLHQRFFTLDDALVTFGRPGHWLVADKEALRPGQKYDVTVRMQLDIAPLSRPLQFHVVGESWYVSGNYRFSFTVE